MTAVAQRLDDSLINTETLMQQVTNDIDRMDSCLPSQINNFSNEIGAKLNEIDVKIAKMAGEARSLSPSTRDYYDEEIENMRNLHSRLVSEFRKKQTLSANNPNVRQGQQLENNLEKSTKITENLDVAISLGNDSITTANATLTTLYDDRKHINNINDNLDIVHTEALTGANRAKRMVRRALYNNFLIWTIVFLLVVLLGFSLYWKLRKPKSEESS
ncbi:Vesicle transport v-SNARE protein [Tritrichomonas foetus]|uniref:Vesicle transport v-SNARE protein n=1 Tax=Tritrichomonas foetus TaxID=1144522 RepID=A0A1J4KEB6_9EUKA|nr:Vesicle transport v-SNARE protein [Tritrichomonas foetus]|eukprot:OHT09777.1 Vesicle transport v-SNARE protein [Tritrichomonas foetus]